MVWRFLNDENQSEWVGTGGVGNSNENYFPPPLCARIQRALDSPINIPFDQSAMKQGMDTQQFEQAGKTTCRPPRTRNPGLHNWTLYCKVYGMKANWAEENLQTIRTLMERSALYRRALAPIMLFAGALGLIAAAAGLFFHIEAPRAFAGLWFGTAITAVAVAFLLTRRQALKDQEPFWSPPTRRVGLALLPPLFCGFFIGVMLASIDANWSMDFPMALFWVLFYGCALHSAGFFMMRGIKWFGLAFIFSAVTLMILMYAANWSLQPHSGNLLMGCLFGAGHVVYGAYLYLTEKGNRAT